MVVFPNSKINLGLNVVERRADGYHNLETVFFPVSLPDVLEVLPATKTQLEISGIHVEGRLETNLVYRAWELLKEDFGIPPVQIFLHKVIPMGAGLGGGSSDGAFMLKLLNRMFELQLDSERLKGYAVRLGADCPFFIDNLPAFATGIGDRLNPVKLDLSLFKLIIVKPPVSVNTGMAYKSIVPMRPAKSVTEIVSQPLETWRGKLSNDFEKPVFEMFPEIMAVRDKLYEKGALYAAMSGSGSAVYGLFTKEPADLQESFPSDYFIFSD